MDALSNILEMVKIKGAVYFKTDFSSPWGMDIPTGPFAQFHMVVQGKCKLKTKQNKGIDLYAGDLIIFPFGEAHWIADKDSSTKHKGSEVVASIWKEDPIFKGDDLSATLICGHFEFDRSLDHGFVNSLPPIIHITDMERKEFTWLERISHLIIEESGAGLVGNDIAVNRLAEVLFIHALRAYILQNKEETGFYAALKNPKLSRVLAKIHNSPEYNWNLENMAGEAAMSRTLFANKFKEIVGQTPLHYITNWRILKAKQILKESSVSISEVAEKVGYSSEAAFNRVFKKKVQKTPAVYRRTAP